MHFEDSKKNCKKGELTKKGIIFQKTRHRENNFRIPVEKNLWGGARNLRPCI